MKKWYKVLNPYGTFSRGAIICPEGLTRESLQVRGMITRQPVYIGPRKPTPEDIAAYGRPAPEPVVEPEPVPEPEPEPEPAPNTWKRRRR